MNPYEFPGYNPYGAQPTGYGVPPSFPSQGFPPVGDPMYNPQPSQPNYFSSQPGQPANFYNTQPPNAYPSGFPPLANNPMYNPQPAVQPNYINTNPSHLTSQPGYQTNPPHLSSQPGYQTNPSHLASQPGYQTNPSHLVSQPGYQTNPSPLSSQSGYQTNPSHLASQPGYQTNPSPLSSQSGYPYQTSPPYDFRTVGLAAHAATQFQRMGSEHYTNVTNNVPPPMAPDPIEVPIDRAPLTDEELKSKTEDAQKRYGTFPLVIDPEIGTPKTDNSYIELLKKGVLLKKHCHYETKQDVTLKLSDDCEVAVYANHGFIYLKYVTEIKKGAKTTILKNAQADNAKSFSLVYGPNTLDFEAITTELCEVIMHSLIYWINQSKNKSKTDLASSLEKTWKETYTLDHQINQKEALALILNVTPVKFKQEEVQFSSHFNNVDSNKDGKISFPEFIRLMRLLRSYSAMEDVFKRYSTNGKMDDEQFHNFILVEQKNKNVSKEKVKEWIKIQNRYDENPSNYLTFESFCDFLQNEQINDAFNYEKYGYVYQDMSRPLSYYLISSSHNTYCTGHQLKGLASVEMYAKVLRDGCRCLELDCWDSNKQYVPKVTHGLTLVSDISFRDVLKCIYENAFITSPYPVVLSIENHCTLPFQETMARDFQDIFGDFLAIPPPNLSELPSPEELEKKIILKGPTNPHYYDDWEMELADGTKVPQKLSKISDNLAKITYLRSSRLKYFEDATINGRDIVSFEEIRIEANASTDEAVKHINFNKKQLSRIYPKGLRTDSSNFDPVPSWNLGCQMAALNCQTSGEPMWMNEGKFKDNGSCGYVLVPPILSEHSDFRIERDYAALQKINPNTIHGTLIVRVLGARQLPKPKDASKSSAMKAINAAKKSANKKSKIKPNFTVGIAGSTLDSREYKGIADQVHQLFSPDWHHNQPFRFSIYFGESALLLVRIDHASGRIAYSCLPIKCISEGYRVLLLSNGKGERIPFCSMLVHFSWEK